MLDLKKFPTPDKNPALLPPPHIFWKFLFALVAVEPRINPLPPALLIDGNAPAPTVPFGGVGLFKPKAFDTAPSPKAPRTPPRFGSICLVGLGIIPKDAILVDAKIGIRGLYILVSLKVFNPCNTNCLPKKITPLPLTLNFDTLTTSCNADPIGNALLSYLFKPFTPFLALLGLTVINGCLGPNLNKPLL